MYQILFHPAKQTEAADPDLEASDSDDKPNPNPQHIIIHIHENNRPPKDKPLTYPIPQGWQYGQPSNGQVSIYGEEYPKEDESRSIESQVSEVPEDPKVPEEIISTTDVPVEEEVESTTIIDDDDEIYLENLDLFEDETETDANNSTKDE